MKDENRQVSPEEYEELSPYLSIQSLEWHEKERVFRQKGGGKIVPPEQVRAAAERMMADFERYGCD